MDKGERRRVNALATERIQMLTTFDQIQDLVVEQLGVDAVDVTPAVTFADGLSADSLDRINLMMACEEAFDIHIDDPEAEAVKTVADLVALVDGKLESKGART